MLESGGAEVAVRGDVAEVPLGRNDLDAKHPLEQRLARITWATRDARRSTTTRSCRKAGWS